MTRDEFIKQLSATVLTDRRTNYGPPEKNFDRIANLWGVYRHLQAAKCRDNGGSYDDLGQGFDQMDVTIMMILMKVARIIETPTHMDSWLDIAGYAACGAEIAAGERW